MNCLRFLFYYFFNFSSINNVFTQNIPNLVLKTLALSYKKSHTFIQFDSANTLQYFLLSA